MRLNPHTHSGRCFGKLSKQKQKNNFHKIQKSSSASRKASVRRDRASLLLEAILDSSLPAGNSLGFTLRR